ncbi:hypothetical protein [Paludibacterium purpuratum]|uniref:Uncharacterized protein n=1 Tax=Paludibacterium purpuratum TaxID=1144873 RepID=A0A4R7BAZ7_9NEIS|nr:hypothetical protein [Paludibacterium purpuratum]TDR82140.1 hypothetical protein DFP86_102254 [Paludibacterium purpuratum]
MISTDRFDAEALSTLRSLISGFPSLKRAYESTGRYALEARTEAQLAALTPCTRARVALLAALHPLLAQLMALGIPATTLLHEVPFLLYSIKRADEDIRNGHEFHGFER